MLLIEHVLFFKTARYVKVVLKILITVFELLMKPIDVITLKFLL